MSQKNGCKCDESRLHTLSHSRPVNKWTRIITNTLQREHNDTMFIEENMFLQVTLSKSCIDYNKNMKNSLQSVFEIMICSHDLRRSSWVSIEHIGLSWNWRLLVLRHQPDQLGLNQHKKHSVLKYENMTLEDLKSTTWALCHVVLKAGQGTSSCCLRSSSPWCCSRSWGRPRWPGAGTTRPLSSSLMRSSSNGGKLTNPTFDWYLTYLTKTGKNWEASAKTQDSPSPTTQHTGPTSLFGISSSRWQIRAFKSGPFHTFAQPHFHKP